MKCFERLYDVCPIGSEWLNIVTLWATTLDGQSFDMSVCEGFSGDFTAQERQIIQKAEIPRLLKDPDAVIAYCNTGWISHDVCLDLIRSRFLHKRTVDGSTLKQAILSFQVKFKGVLKDWMRSKAA